MTQQKKTYLNPREWKRLYHDPSRRRTFMIAGGILLAIIILYPKLSPLISDIPLFTPEDEPEIVRADGHFIETEQLDSNISATGTLRAIQEVELSTEVSGMVIGIHFEEGGEVEEGQLLIKVNDNDLQAERDRLETNIELMEETAARQQQLFERGGATQEDYDNTVMQLNNLRAEYAAVQVQIERTEVRAPFEGRVGLNYISTGAYVTPSSQIATLQNMDSVRIDFSVPERYSASVFNGNEIRFYVQGVDSVFTGRVAATEPQIDPRTRTLQVRAVTDNSDGLLNPGSFANVELILDTFEDAILIPSVALIPDSGNYKVYIYDDGVVREQFVETGIRTRDRVQILEGLQPGDMVLTSALLRLSEGSRVELRTSEN
jgi:membrane fusion protein, multidrug efflux system